MPDVITKLVVDIAPAFTNTCVAPVRRAAALLAGVKIIARGAVPNGLAKVTLITVTLATGFVPLVAT